MSRRPKPVRLAPILRDAAGLALGDFEDLAEGYFRDRAERAAEGHAGRLGEWLDEVLPRRRHSGRAEEAWPVILALISRASTDEDLAFVAAGPLECLVRFHSREFADRLVKEAHRDPRFRVALRGVWGWEDVPEPTRARLLRELGVA